MKEIIYSCSLGALSWGKIFGALDAFTDQYDECHLFVSARVAKDLQLENNCLWCHNASIKIGKIGLMCGNEESNMIEIYNSDHIYLNKIRFIDIVPHTGA